VMLLVPAFRDRIPIVLDQVTTVCGPGELVDVVVTERGVCINPLRQDLLDAVKGSALPLLTIEDLKRQVDKMCGGAPQKPKVTDKIVAAIKWVDGTVLDSVRQIAPK
jgi:citrate lyase subunit alpha / citrate CoA-transferase